MLTLEMILGILLAGLLTDNYALIQCLGTGAVIENERSTRKSLVLGLGTTVVVILCNLICWPLNNYLLVKVPYLQTMAFVLVLIFVVAVLHQLAKKLLDGYCHSDFTKFAINGAILGLCIENTELDFLHSVVVSIAMGLGLTLTMTLFARLHNSLDEEAVPKSFRGLPIALLTAGMIVLAILALDFGVSFK